MPAKRIKQFDKDPTKRSHRTHRSKGGYKNKHSTLWKEHNKSACNNYKGNKKK